MKPVLPLLLFCLFFVCQSTVHAQTWTFRNGFGQAGAGFPDKGSAICTDAAGNVYITGKISDAAAGNTVNFGGGALTSAGDDDGFVAKFTSAGAHVWSIRFGGSLFVDEGFGIATNGTHVYVTGEVNGAMTVGTSPTSYPVAGGSGDGFVMKLDVNTGAAAWVTRFGGANTDRGQAICLDASNNIYISGYFRTRTANPNATFGAFTRTVQGNTTAYTSDLFVAKLNDAGVFQWVSAGGSAGGNDNINGSGICYVPALDEVVVTGNHRSLTGTAGSVTATYNPGGVVLTNPSATTNEEFALLEVDAATGNFLSGSGVGAGDGNEAGMGIVYDAFTSSVMFTGYFSSASVTFPGHPAVTNGSGATRHNILYGRYNPATDAYVWIREVENSSPANAADDGFAIATNGAGGIFITGQFRNTITFPGGATAAASGSMSDLYVAKVSAADGNSIWATQGVGNHPAGDDIGYGIALRGSEVWVTGWYLSNLTLGALPALASAGGTEDVLLARLIDPASVTSVSVPANGTYKIGDQLNFTVNYNTAVTVTGTPVLPLTIGATGRNASYLSGSGTTALVFRYTVQAGDFDNNGIAVGASLGLNGGTIRNVSTTVDASLTLNNVATTASVNVDGVAPTVSSINRQSATNPTNSTSVVYRISFSETVSGVDITDFQLTATGTAAGTVASVSAASGTAIDITVNGVSGNGTLRLDLNASGTGITDAAGNPVSGGFTTGQTFTIDNQTQAPTLTSPAAGNTYSSPVQVTATLPETPLAGSVQLVFSNVSNTVTLTLADATSYNFPFNINDPNAAAQITAASGPLPPGTYTATLRYQDALGNTAGATANGSVTISFALPVSLTAFEADRQGDGARLRWTTAAEQNSDRFEVLHSANGADFISIGEVAASGNSSAVVHYGFSHATPGAGWNYYRLRMIDRDGSSTLSDIRRVLFDAAGKVRIYPNPARNMVQVRYQLSGVRSVALIDLSGRVMTEQQNVAGSNEARFNTAGLAPGIYTVRIIHAEGTTALRFVKE